MVSSNIAKELTNYAYDHLGNRILEKDNRDTLHYTYNKLNRLVQKKAFNGISTYEYDKRGNRTKIECRRRIQQDEDRAAIPKLPPITTPASLAKSPQNVSRFAYRVSPYETSPQSEPYATANVLCKQNFAKQGAAAAGPPV